MPRVNLTARTLPVLRPDPVRQIDYWDRSLPGFGVRVAPGGRKTFTILYRQDGKVKRFTLGTHPPLSLADARDEATLKLAEIRAKGADPQAERVQARQAPEIDSTFGALARHFLERNATLLRPNTIDAWTRIVRVEILPVFGERESETITRGEIRAFVQGIVERGTPYWANRVFEVVRRVFNWAVEEDLLAASPCVGLRKPGVEQARDRVLTSEEIAQVWRVLDEEGPIGRAVKLLFYTGARRGEVLSMRWRELDLVERLWRIPAARTKNHDTHVVPLSAGAMGVIETLGSTDDKLEWLFPSPTGAGPIWAPQKAAERIRQRSGVAFRLHDIRRTVATGLAALGTPPAIVSAVLGHTPPGPAATQVYNRYAPVREMRVALEAWAAHLAGVVSGEARRASVVPLLRR